MQENTKKKIASVFVVIGSLGWRRWFGGGFGKLGDITRFWKYLALIVICFSMYYTKYPYYTFWQDIKIWLVVVSFSIHWAVGHGDYFYLLDTGKDEGRIKWIDCVLKRIYGENGYYNFKGNVTGMLLRYTSTAILVSFSVCNPLFLVAGLATATAYILTCKLPKPIVWAEFLSGAVNFWLLYLCIGG